MDSEKLNKHILRYLNNELTDSEVQQFESMINHSEENRAYFAEIKTLYGLTSGLKLPDFNSEQAYNLAQSSLSDKITHRNLIYKAAALLIVVVGIGYLLTSNLPNKTKQFVEIYVKEGEKTKISLPDGNNVYMNSETILKYPIDYDKNKQIYLIGEAYFEFSPYDNIPIEVVINEIILRGSRASFNVKHHPEKNKSEIIVHEGQVFLSNPQWNIENFILEQGQAAYVDTLLPLFIQENKDLNYLAWKTEELRFDKTPLFLVIETLSDYFDTPISIDHSLNYCRFTSNYENAELDDIIKDIKEEFNTEVKLQNNEVHLKGGDC